MSTNISASIRVQADWGQHVERFGTIDAQACKKERLMLCGLWLELNVGFHGGFEKVLFGAQSACFGIGNVNIGRIACCGD